MVNSARSPNSDRYSPNWLGPAIDQPLPWGQLAALDVLTSSIGLDLSLPPSSPSPPSPSAPPAPSGLPPNENAGPSPENSHHKAAIIGGTIGGLVFLVIAALLVFFMIRHRRKTLIQKSNSNLGSRHSRRPIPETVRGGFDIGRDSHRRSMSTQSASGEQR